MLDKVVREFASTEDMIRQGEFVIQSELTKLFFLNKIINSYLYFQLQFFLSTQLIISVCQKELNISLSKHVSFIPFYRLNYRGFLNCCADTQ